MLSGGAMGVLSGSAPAVRRSESKERAPVTTERRVCAPPPEFPDYCRPLLPLAPVRTRPEAASTPRTPAASPRKVSFETTPFLEAAALRPAKEARTPGGPHSPAGMRSPAGGDGFNRSAPVQTGVGGDRSHGTGGSSLMALKTPRSPSASPGLLNPLFSPKWTELEDFVASKQCELHIGQERNVVMRLTVAKPGTTPRSASASPCTQTRTQTAGTPSSRSASGSDSSASSVTPRSPASPFSPFPRFFGLEQPAGCSKEEALRCQQSKGFPVPTAGEATPKVGPELSSPGKRATPAAALDQRSTTPSLTAVRMHARAHPFVPSQQAHSSKEAAALDGGTACNIDVPRFVEVEIEVAKGSFVKHKPDGSIDYMMFLPCPFNYGCVPAFDALDGDPQDALVLGPRIPRGHTASLRVEAMLKFTDAGMVDHKLVCTQQRPAAEEVPAPERHRTSTSGPKRFGLLLSGFWWKRGSRSDALLLGHEGMPMCAASCPGRHDTGIALPVAKARTSLKCALCGGAKPFPRTGVELGCAHRASIPRRASEQQHGGASADAIRVCGGELVQMNLSLKQFILVTGFFRFFATCKHVLNTVRGRKGLTHFAGWEVARSSHAS